MVIVKFIALASIFAACARVKAQAYQPYPTYPGYPGVPSPSSFSPSHQDPSRRCTSTLHRMTTSTPTLTFTHTDTSTSTITVDPTPTVSRRAPLFDGQERTTIGASIAIGYDDINTHHVGIVDNAPGPINASIDDDTDVHVDFIGTRDVEDTTTTITVTTTVPGPTTTTTTTVTITRPTSTSRITTVVTSPRTFTQTDLSTSTVTRTRTTFSTVGETTVSRRGLPLATAR